MKNTKIKITVAALTAVFTGLYLFSDYSPFKRYLKGEKEIKAIAKAYSGYIDKVDISEEQRAFRLNNKWYCWSGGKLIPESMLERKDNYISYGFYEYPLKYPKKSKKLTKKNLKRIKNYSSGKRSKKERNPSFLNAIYGGRTYREINKNIRDIEFLGKKVKVHKLIIPQLKKIEKNIIETAAKDISIIDFMDSLNDIACFSWRNIDNSRSRSYHSYGAAIDLIPKNPHDKAVYWRWTKNYDKDWYKISYKERWQVPQKIVEIFESYGFVWGGKWLFYDNMHFEYRPEILILAGKELKER